jgi:hypothetical protein
MGTSDSEYSSDVLVRNLKSREEVIKNQGAKKKTGCKEEDQGFGKAYTPRKSRMARYNKENEEDDDDDMDNSPKASGMNNDKVEEENAGEDEDNFVAVRRRNRAKKPWSNSCMQQFKNAAGLIEISWLSFSENEVTEITVRVLLGTKVSQMNPDKISKTVDWYKQLKVQASNYCKDQAVEDLLYGASQIGIPFKNIEAIKSRWKECSTTDDLLRMGQLISRMQIKYQILSQKGDPNTWNVKLETDFMKHYNLACLPNEFPKKILGCIAKQAARSMNDLGRRMNCVGQTKHKQIVTKRTANLGGKSRSRSVVGNTSHPSFVRTSETKSNSAMNMTDGGVGLKKKKAS